MRVRRLAVRNLRGVADREVILLADGQDCGVTIVEGHNETGKTSLGDALYALVDAKATSRAAVVRSLATFGRDEATVVEADIETGPYRLTYTKHFLVRPKTELVLHAPAEERMGGDDAHERVVEIVAETIDRDLWEALRLRQASGLEQAAVAGNAALAAALSRRAQLTAIRDREAELLDAVFEEYLAYFTRNHRSKRARANIAAAVESCRRELEAAEAQYAQLEDDVDKIASLRRRLPEFTVQLRNARAEAETAQETLAALARLEGEIEGAELRLQTARSEADVALRERDQRRKAVDEVGRAQQRLQAIDQKRPDLQELSRIARAQVEELGQELGGLETQRRSQAGQVDRAADDAQHLEHLTELTDLRDRLTRAREARTVLHDARSAASRLRVDDEAVAELRDLSHELALADAGLAAASSSVTFTAARDVSLTIDGREEALAQGEAVQRRVIDGLDLIIADVGQVSVRSGADISEEARRREEAEARLRETLERLGVEDLDAAERVREERAAAERDATEAERLLAECLGGADIGALEDREAGLKALVAAYGEDRPSDPPLPADAAAARQEEEATRRELEANDAAIVACRERLELQRTAREQHDQELVRLEAERAEVQRGLDGAADALSRERSERSDEQAEREAEEAAARVEQAQRALDDLRSELEAHDATGARERTENLVAVHQDAEQRLRDTEREIDRLEASVQARGAEGLYSKVETARAALEDAERNQRSTERRAEAAALLYKTLARHRELARERYAEPLRERVCDLGRRIYGYEFDVEFDEDLRIARRRLDGLWLETEALSDGAKEQLALLGRLACASLVSQDGSPGLLLIDDALGNTDPDRLGEIGAVLRLAGQDCQIVIFTCYPDRYRHIGGAKRVRLD